MSATSDRRRSEAGELPGRGLSAREVRILALADQGYSASEIVDMLQAGGRGNDPERPLGGVGTSVEPEGRSTAVVLLAGLFSAAIFVADLIIGGEDSPILFLLVVPVAVLAMEFTTTGALVAASLATMLIALAAVITGQELATGAFVAQVTALGLVAIVVGTMSARMHVLTRKLDVAERESSLETLVDAVDTARRPKEAPARRRRRGAGQR
jgi:hypothetical protein